MEQPEEGVGRKACFIIDAINLRVAKIFSYVVVIMMVTVTYEVVCRYLFNAPTDWAGEMNEYLLCVMALLGGGYALLVDQHVRVDILFRFFSPKRRAIVELFTWWLIVIFCLVLIWRGGEMAIDALVEGKKSMTILEFPLFPSLVIVPIGGFLLFLQAIARIVRDIMTLKTGIDEVRIGKSLFE